MQLREISEGKGWTRIEKWRWWWPFWTLHEYKYVRPDPASMLIVPKDYKAERTARGFAEVKKPKGFTAPVNKAKIRKDIETRDRRVDRSDSSDFATGVIVGSLLSGGKSDVSPAPAPVPDFSPGGGSYGGGGASGSWSDDSSSSSSSSSYDSSSSSSSYDSGGSS